MIKRLLGTVWPSTETGKEARPYIRRSLPSLWFDQDSRAGWRIIFVTDAVIATNGEGDGGAVGGRARRDRALDPVGIHGVVQFTCIGGRKGASWVFASEEGGGHAIDDDRRGSDFVPLVVGQVRNVWLTGLLMEDG